MKFFTAYNYPPSIAEPPCPKVIDELQLNEATGKIEKVGTIPFYERIQSHADSCRLDIKLKRYQQGDLTALGVPGGSYGDFSNQPGDLAQVLQAKQEAERQFGELSEGIRAVFGNDYHEFVRSLQDGTYQSRLASYAASELAKVGNLSGVKQNSGNPGQAQGGE